MEIRARAIWHSKYFDYAIYGISIAIPVFIAFGMGLPLLMGWIDFKNSFTIDQLTGLLLLLFALVLLTIPTFPNKKRREGNEE